MTAAAVALSLTVALFSGERLVVDVPSKGSELFSAARHLLREGGFLTPLVSEQCGQYSSEECHDALRRRVCEGMAGILVQHHNLLITEAMSSRMAATIAEAVTAVSASAVDTAHCFLSADGERPVPGVAYGVGAGGLRFYANNGAFTPVDGDSEQFLEAVRSGVGGIRSSFGDRGALRSATMDDIVRNQLVHVAQACLMLEESDPTTMSHHSHQHPSQRLSKLPCTRIAMALAVSIDPAQPDDEETFRRMLSITAKSFRSFEWDCYGPIIEELTRRMLLTSKFSNNSHVEGGLFNPDSKFLDVYPTEFKRECLVSAVMDALVEQDKDGQRRPRIRRMLEVGMNGGHSAAMVLAISNGKAGCRVGGDSNAASVETRVVAFDICRYAYTRSAAEYLNGTASGFHGRLDLKCGDSQETLPRFAAVFREKRDQRQQQNCSFQEQEQQQLRTSKNGSCEDDGRDSRSVDDEDDEESEPRFSFAFIDGLHTYDATLSDLRASRAVSAPGAVVVLDDCDHGDVAAAWDVFVAEGGATPQRQGVCWRGMCIGRFT